MATYDFIPAGVDVGNIGSDKFLYIYGGNLIVERNGSNYVFSLESKLQDGRTIKLFYEGLIYLEKSSAAAMTYADSNHSAFLVR